MIKPARLIWSYFPKKDSPSQAVRDKVLKFCDRRLVSRGVDQAGSDVGDYRDRFATVPNGGMAAHGAVRGQRS